MSDGKSFSSYPLKFNFEPEAEEAVVKEVQTSLYSEDSSPKVSDVDGQSNTYNPKDSKFEFE